MFINQMYHRIQASQQSWTPSNMYDDAQIFSCMFHLSNNIQNFSIVSIYTYYLFIMYGPGMGNRSQLTDYLRGFVDNQQKSLF